VAPRFLEKFGPLFYLKLFLEGAFAVLECYTAYVGSWLPTFRDNLTVSYLKGRAFSEEQRS
jgi:hypothetical protein